MRLALKLEVKCDDYPSPARERDHRTGDGSVLSVWALVLVSSTIAVLAAIVLQVYGLGFCAGVSVVIGCLVVGQLAYLLAAFRLHKGDISVQDEARGDPGEHCHQDVPDEHQ